MCWTKPHSWTPVSDVLGSYILIHRIMPGRDAPGNDRSRRCPHRWPRVPSFLERQAEARVQRTVHAERGGRAMKSRGEALRDYVIRRLLLMVPTFLGITFVTFLILQFVPGGQIVASQGAAVAVGPA